MSLLGFIPYVHVHMYIQVYSSVCRGCRSAFSMNLGWNSTIPYHICFLEHTKYM